MRRFCFIYMYFYFQILRNLDTITYECSIEIVTKSKEYTILLSLRFPTNFNTQCELNREAFVIYKRNKCRRLCDFEDLYQTERYVTTTVSGRLRLHFISNSTINTELNVSIFLHLKLFVVETINKHESDVSTLAAKTLTLCL